ncbi:methyl-accepting chemotaxis protein [Actinoplanes sp. TBRC 11911]|uniref:methyl-accepting chemotaxis protein n=1 Tax=Actinoplanes sp. TBRC 11911 TaxID=2729386 RepID=UPI00145DC9FE|nr:methyl-accepting chemotaxis protein [Actinoplanes sp. TBRC 11911]NMO54274.1 methyl-accepting chemotaxis protein [Actinoplanes sp. TBRC 11911]
MARRTFGKKVALGFGLTIALTVIMGATSVTALTIVSNAKDDAISLAADDLVTAEALNTKAEIRISDYRLFLINGDQAYLDLTNADRRDFLALTTRLHATLKNPVSRTLLGNVLAAEASHARSLEPVIARRLSNPDLRALGAFNEATVATARTALRDAIAGLTSQVRADVEKSRTASSIRATQAILLIICVGLVAIAFGAGIAWRLNQHVRRQIGAAVGHIQNSSAELEAAAAELASGGRDQASSMNQINMTISELLITARQIADGAKRVSKIAEDTSDAARRGDATINQTRTSITAIRTQVDQIVQHMLALGKKSQQIGGIADLAAELAEQTNILAINATIEASGAGEWGRRFAVVAEEIRKLADRTADSAKEIRTLIDDVRGAVNMTVTATETGAQSVDAGARQFDDATSSFRRIAELVATTNDATREIELSTKQQTTAVEQVNVAAADTARVTRQTETNATQTKQTAAHLSQLSSDLLELVGTGRR